MADASCRRSSWLYGRREQWVYPMLLGSVWLQQATVTDTMHELLPFAPSSWIAYLTQHTSVQYCIRMCITWHNSCTVVELLLPAGKALIAGLGLSPNRLLSAAWVSAISLVLNLPPRLD
jgi:hypothetical protein